MHTMKRATPLSTRGTGFRGRRRAFGALAVLAAAGLVIGACGGPEAPDHEAELPILRAPAGTALRLERPLEVEIFGTVEANRTVAVSARVLAMVTSVKVRAGDRVVRGQTLLEIDPQAAEGQLAQARGALAQARAALTLSERNFQRFEALASTDAASQLELDTARMHFEQARGAVEQAEGAVQAAAAVAADARVTAPFDARVVRRMVEVGDLAAPGRPLLMLESEQGRRLSIEVPESVVAGAGLRVGQRIPISIDARPDLGLFEGEVVEAAPGVDPKSHTLTAKVDLPLEDLPSGSAGRARIATGSRELVAVPPEAVLERGGLSLVVVVTAEGRAATRAVTVGERWSTDEGAELLEILSGLAGGERVLLGLAAPPPAGSKVEIEP